MVRQTLERGAHCPGRTRSNIILEPTELLSDGSFLAQLYPTPKARRHRVDGIAVRVVEDVLDTDAAPGQPVYRLITSLLDEQAFPAQLLASTYCERWEIEATLDEVEVHQWAHPRPLRSQHPREVVQEVYGLLLAHLAIRTCMHSAALQGGKDPDRLRFTGALRVLRRAIPRAQRTPPPAVPLICEGLPRARGMVARGVCRCRWSAKACRGWIAMLVQSPHTPPSQPIAVSPGRGAAWVKDRRSRPRSGAVRRP